MMKFTLLKSHCILCDAPVAGAVSLCGACRDDLPRVGYACKACAIPLDVSENINAKVDFCGSCLQQKNSVDYAENVFYYDNPIDYLIGEMKFNQRLAAASVLGDLLKAHIENSKLSHGLPDIILPMPLHKKRLLKRGFNQALEIVKPVAKAQKIAIELDLVERSKETKTQTHLNKQQRRKNVSGCFALLSETKLSKTNLPKLKAAHVVIVDDVVTTGSTTNELAKLLKKSGAEKVGVWSLARAELG